MWISAVSNNSIHVCTIQYYSGSSIRELPSDRL